ncbi:MAG TPA: class E sortase [Acidimicrobiales bacterium]|nr:class E sortase [Acidimicrobiales bacterium]
MQKGQLTGALGRVLLCVGSVILLFVAYQLWGTNLAESHSQDTLRQQLDHELHRVDGATGATSTPTTMPGPTSADPAPTTTAPAEGAAVALLQIPKIGVNKVVVEGTNTPDLRQGPGHYQGTPLPGQAGNAAIAGHRTTYGAPFYNLDALQPGDEIMLTTPQGTFTYKVARSMVVSPSDRTVLAASSTPELTLTTCNPRFSASSRLVVQATLVSSIEVSRSKASTTTTTTTTPKGLTVGSAAADGLAGGQGNWQPALLWGIGVLVAGAAVLLLGRRRHQRRQRWLVYGAGGVGVLVVLFFFFGSVSPLLPASF